MHPSNVWKLVATCLAVVALAACGPEWAEATVLPVCDPPTMEVPGQCVRMYPCSAGDTRQAWCIPPEGTARPEAVEPSAPHDAGTVGTVDAGQPAEADAGPVAAGEQDAGSVEAETASDAGTPDAGPPAPFVRMVEVPLGAYVTGIHAVRWESSGVESVRLEVSLDRGATWMPLPGGERLPAAAGVHTFTVDRAWRWEAVPGGAGVLFRAVDVDDPERVGVAPRTTWGACYANNQGLRLNEVEPPGFNGRGGFVEIVSLASEPINLEGWTFAGSFMGAPRYTFPAGVVVPAGGVLVVHNPDTVPAVPAGVALLAVPASALPSGVFVLDGRCHFGLYYYTGDGWGARTGNSAYNAPGAYKGPGVAVTRSPDVVGAWTWTVEVDGLKRSPGFRADGAPFGTDYAVESLSFVTPALLPVQPVRTDAPATAWFQLRAAGGRPPYRFALASEHLTDTTLTLDAYAGTLRVAAGAPVSRSVRVLLEDASGARVLRTFDVVVANTAGQTTIPVRAIRDARAGWLYGASLRLHAAGGVTLNGPTWDVVEGALPAGITITPDEVNPYEGHLSGVPTVPGVYSFTVRGAWNDTEAVRSYTLTVK